jgi:hypothetical protein
LFLSPALRGLQWRRRNMKQLRLAVKKGMGELKQLQYCWLVATQVRGDCPSRHREKYFWSTCLPLYTRHTRICQRA